MFSNASPRQLGVMAAIASPVLWGICPIFFHFLMAYALDEVLAHRAIWAAVFIAGLLVLSGDGRKLFTTIETKKDYNEDELLVDILKIDKVNHKLSGKNIMKVINVQNKIINIITN